MPEFKTFNSWSSSGYKIIKGSKATWVNEVAMFSSDQVVKVQPTWRQFGSSRKGKGYNDYMEHDELAEAYGGYGSFWDNV